MTRKESVLDVLTLKRGDSRPVLEMTIDDINEASSQPTDDAGFDGYDADDFESAELIELHMDRYDAEADDYVRVVDGREASWESNNDTVSVQLEREDTAWEAVYHFEWVLIYDAEATSSDDATELQTVPSVGMFEMEVTTPTNRSLAEVSAPDRTVGTLTVETDLNIGGDATVSGSVTADSADLNTLDAESIETTEIRSSGKIVFVHDADVEE